MTGMTFNMFDSFMSSSSWKRNPHFEVISMIFNIYA